MKRIHYALFGIVLGALYCCSEKNEKEAIAIEGTAIRLHPPEGFAFDPAINGLRHKGQSATIMVVSLPKPYTDAVGDLTAEKLKPAGQKLLSREEVSVSGRKGVLCSINRQSLGLDFLQWMLVLPDEKSTITLNGTFLKQDELQLSPVIREALLSATLDPDAPLGEDVLPVEFDPHGLTFTKTMEGPSALYTATGEWSDKSIFSLSYFYTAGILGPDYSSRYDHSVRHFYQVCGTCSLDSIADSVRIDNLMATEAWGYTEDAAKVKTLKYQTMIFDKNRFYLLIGTASDDHANNLDRFKKISRTFRRKMKNS
jgi:hypothetical protein